MRTGTSRLWLGLLGVAAVAGSIWAALARRVDPGYVAAWLAILAVVWLAVWAWGRSRDPDRPSGSEGE